MINFLDATRELALSCGGADVLRIIKFAFILLDLVLYIIPIALIVLLMVDFGKNVMAGKEDEMKKNLNIAIKRIIYCIVLFFVPTIVNFAIGLVSEAYVTDENPNKEDIAGKAASCVDLARNSTKEQLAQWEVDYDNLGDETQDDNDGNSSGSSEANTEVLVSFDANGGVLKNNKEKKCIVGEVYGDLPAPSREGYIFRGWYTEKKYGKEVLEDTEVKTDTPHTLYAHWDVKSVTLTLNFNGGKWGTDSSITKTVYFGETYGSLPNDIVKDKYYFIGWYTDIKNGTRVTENTKVKTHSNHTLYAHWSTDPSKVPDDLKDSDSSTECQFANITIDYNGGIDEYSMSTVTLSVDSCNPNDKTYGDILWREISKKDHVFIGWFTEKNGGTEIKDDDLLRYEDHIIYARWKYSSN